MRKFLLTLTSALILLCSCAGGKTELLTTDEFTTQPSAKPVVQQPAVQTEESESDEFVSREYSEKEIYALYSAAADKVKTYSAGFTAAFTRVCGEMQTVGGSTALGFCIASLAQENNIGAALTAFEKTVEHGDALTVNSLFPLCGEEKGCREDGLKCVSEAFCEENSEYLNITIRFSECASSSAQNNLSAVLALNLLPSVGEELVKKIGDTSQIKLFSEYSDGLLHCVIEKSTSRMVYLMQSVNVENYVDIITEFVFSACQAQLLCPYTDEITFDDFDWN